MSRFVRGVLLPASSAPLLTVREALFSIWGGLALLLTTLLLMRLLVLPMSTEQPVSLRLAASALVAVGCAVAVSMMAAGVRNRIVQVVERVHGGGGGDREGAGPPRQSHPCRRRGGPRGRRFAVKGPRTSYRTWSPHKAPTT